MRRTSRRSRSATVTMLESVNGVLAIGNPLGEGLTFTVTSGIVSAQGERALNGLPGRGQGSIQDFIQDRRRDQSR